MSEWYFDHLTPFKYGKILADPAWKHVMRSAKGELGGPGGHYKTMTLDQLKAMPVEQLAGPGCLIFMWATWPHLQQALELMEAWRFKYITGGAWLKRTKKFKPGFGQGYVLRSATEPFLVGRMGPTEIASRSERNVIINPLNFPDLIDSLRREHSRKPPEMREILERLLPRQHGVELFAREPWPGHDVWGNEVDKFSEVTDG